MPTLRLRQRSIEAGQHLVDVELSGVPNQAPLTAVSTFAFELTPADREDLRWYLEDFLQFPHDPAPTIARRIEGRIADLGTELFRAVFESNGDARDLWAQVRPRLHETRVEIGASVRDVALIPWELLLDPRTASPLALHAPAFIRAQQNTARTVRLLGKPAPEGGPIRILLVICRPGGREDVPFRSVASRLIKGLAEQTRQRYQLDVLRPPTFARLGEVLRRARDDGRPYHAVHFDGHGIYLDTLDPARIAELLHGLGSVVLGTVHRGKHGYLCFENPGGEINTELVGGTALGDLLYQTQTPVLVLNACRSAHAAPLETPGGKPVASDTPDEAAAAAHDAPAEGDPHAQVRAFGSLAQEVIDQGVAGVVAMRYNVYVVTAAQFVADLYGALARGRSLGEAVSHGRKQLAAQPQRSIAYDFVPLQDWSVPVVFEAAPIRLFPESVDDGGGLRIAAKAAAGGEGSTGAGGIAMDLPRSPDAGFFGRDETLLALDRAFDTDNVVLLHALAGSGKTATAAEFARWYHGTGGLRDGRGGSGRMLFTRFEHYTPLRSALGQFGRAFGPVIETAGVNWSALTETKEMREVALQVLRQAPLLWIWDNVEPIHGFPRGSASDWSQDEQNELGDFLRAVRGTKAKILLTSRRDEDAWLGDLPGRVTIPAMPMTERVQLARAIVEKRGGKFTVVEDWRPLLLFTQGNPLTIIVMVRQALRERLTSREQIEAFVGKLRAGEVHLKDEKEDGRSRSLGASLGYGFAAAFDDTERRRLALLYLFQGFVDGDVLRCMGTPGKEWCVPEIRGLTREDWVGLLDRAVDVGLLTAHGGGCYGIHPALPWFLRSLFDQHYPEEVLAAGSAAPTCQNQTPRSRALRAFVEAVGGLGSYYHGEYEGGNRNALLALAPEEANLCYARRMARANGWQHCVVGTMQGLDQLYDHTGRHTEWRRLVEETALDFVDPTTDGPLSGREGEWDLVTEYRVRLAWGARDWPAAERLQRLRVDRAHREAAPLLRKAGGELDPAARNIVRTLAVSLGMLGHIQREHGEAECVTLYRESLGLLGRIDDKAAAAACAFNLGTAHKNIAALRDLNQAESWYRRSLDMHDEDDGFGRGKCLNQLGSVAWERFREVCATSGPKAERLRLVREAAKLYHQALALLPEWDADDRAVAEGQLGAIYGAAGDLERALPHYRESIGLFEGLPDVFRAAHARLGVAVTLAGASRFADAREYALAALRNYRASGAGAAAEVEKAVCLLAQIETDLERQRRRG